MANVLYDDILIDTLIYVESEVAVDLSAIDPKTDDVFLKELPDRLKRYETFNYVHRDDEGNYRITENGNRKRAEGLEARRQSRKA